MRKQIISLLIFTSLVLLLCSCQSKSIGSKEPTKSTKTTSPSQIDTIESDAEDIITDITSSKWSESQSKVTEIKNNFTTLKPKLEAAGVTTDVIDSLGSTISALESAVNASNSYESRKQANQISKYIPDIYDYYTVSLPTDIGRLDYLGREIILNAENSDWSSAGTNYDTASSLWRGLKSQLKSAYSKDSDNFQSNMDSLKIAINNNDSSLTTDQANILLENVDVLENDFTAQKK
jgi:hypothetical protein